MTDRPVRVVFMGTPEFAVQSLDAIVNAGFEVAAVVTVPDKPSGRGQKMTASPVKEYAIEHGLSLLQPVKLREPSFAETLKELHADIFVVVAFRMLPEQVWNIPPLGTFNAHASLLPQYRGAAPINHAIINGEKISGVTTFLLDQEIDTGKILLAETTPVDDNETAGELHDRLMMIAASLVVKTIRGLSDNTITPVQQGDFSNAVTEIRNAPKIFPEDTVTDWHKEAKSVHDFIRGLSPYPCAKTTIVSGNSTIRLKILGSRLADQQLSTGEIKATNGRLFIGCGNGAIEVTSLQAEGRKKMPAHDFLNGFDISQWHIEIK